MNESSRSSTGTTPRTDLRALAEAATPGPWALYAEDHDHQPDWFVTVKDGASFIHTMKDYDHKEIATGWTSPVANGAYIAACSPDVILALLDRLAAAESQRDALEEASETLLRVLDRFEREWLTSRTGYGAVFLAKEGIRAALASPEEEQDDEDRAQAAASGKYGVGP